MRYNLTKNAICSTTLLYKYTNVIKQQVYGKSKRRFTINKIKAPANLRENFEQMKPQKSPISKQ